jgi:hypothetical protein
VFVEPSVLIHNEPLLATLPVGTPEPTSNTAVEVEPKVILPSIGFELDETAIIVYFIIILIMPLIERK